MNVLFALLAFTSLKTDIDGLLATYDQGAPGAAVAVVVEDRVEYLGCFGLANLDYDIPITPDTVFDIGSLAKQFTAACIASLAQEGLLSLEDDIRKYVPEIPEYSQVITVGNLVHHTSGLRDYAVLNILSGGWGKDDTESLLRLLAAQKELDFSPGRRYHYSNSGYALLGLIAERVSGRSLAALAEEKLFRPRGMQAFFNDDENRIIRQRAIGYLRESTGWTMKHDFVQYPLGARGVNASVRDMARWQIFLASDEAAHLRRSGKLAGGEDCAYACGLELREHEGFKTVGHDGYTGSFHCKTLYFPAKKTSIVALANGGLSSSEIVRRVARIVLELEPEDIRETVPVDTAVLESHAGFYKIHQGPVFEVRLEKGQLTAGLRNQEVTPIYPSSETDFFMKVSPVTFSFVREEGRTTQLILNQPHGKMELTRLTESPRDVVESDDFNGTYLCEELLGAEYRFYKENGELCCESPMQKIASINPEARLIPKGEDVFGFSVFSVTFTRTDDRVDGFRLQFSPGQGVRFEKKESAAPDA